ncbi:MAG: hypothetical protein GXY76_13450 [Chloroflexi bacterium]|nr:hypothetical protein [Chloroflexota bacterium]
MKPQDIDKIANVVVGSLAGASGAGVLGCGSISNTQDYDPLCTANAPFQCVGAYECGWQGMFTCGSSFSCAPTTGNLFLCDEGTGFLCGQGAFSCTPQEAYWPTAQLPPTNS